MLFLSTMRYCIIFNTRGPNIEMLPTRLIIQYVLEFI